MAEIMVRYDDLRRYCEKRHCGSVPLEYIKQMPTIEAELVRHGRWIEESPNEYYCSYCGKYAPIEKNMRHCDCSKWCKECGTKMDGGTDNG